MVALLREAHADVRRQLAGELTEFQRDRLEGILAQTQGLITAAINNISDELDTEFAELTAAEVALTQSRINSVLTVNLASIPTVQNVYAAALSRPFEGALLADWMNELDRTSRQRIQRQIQIGITNEETMNQIIARVREAGQTNERNLGGIVRTAVNHVAAFGRHSVYEANADLIKGWYFSATLDSKTTPICRRMDSLKKIYPIGEGPRPPLHIGCRSSDIPILKGNISGIPEGVRASIDGAIPADISYNEFLRRKMTGNGVKQDRAFVREVLGSARYELFKEGRLDVTKFVNRVGKTLTLDELRQRYPKAWQDAFNSSDKDAWRNV